MFQYSNSDPGSHKIMPIASVNIFSFSEKKGDISGLRILIDTTLLIREYYFYTEKPVVN